MQLMLKRKSRRKAVTSRDAIEVTARKRSPEKFSERQQTKREHSRLRSKYLMSGSPRTYPAKPPKSPAGAAAAAVTAAGAKDFLQADSIAASKNNTISSQHRNNVGLWARASPCVVPALPSAAPATPRGHLQPPPPPPPPPPPRRKCAVTDTAAGCRPRQLRSASTNQATAAASDCLLVCCPPPAPTS
ncbi:myb-related transcription factor, partner of profilin-like [Schistocerca nitens]|uniref:myb-related transcription factor, partner of profilin-like n=1 Tax=Schistocerca nitens TaxID=7011 RepID=UPI002118F9BE|nr:myb-related transcription factor, partner of profilin-like [Schistocerca nitens]